MLLYGHIGEVDVCVADVFLLHAEPGVGEACKPTPAQATAAASISNASGARYMLDSSDRVAKW